MYMCVNLEWVAGSRRIEWVTGFKRSGELIKMVYKKIHICVNLEWVAGSRRTAEGLDGLVSLY